MVLQNYEILEELGSGSYGKVYKVRNRITGEICVEKVVNLDGVDERDKEEALNEARLMSQCEHFNIIKYLDSFLENNFLCIIMEYASGGDLTQKIKQQQGKAFKEDLLWNFLIQISQGLKYLHDKRILHRDIKPQNIFLDAEDNVKIGDMGLGRLLGPQSSFASTNVGTPLYQSPELCQEQPYNHKSDVWAFGCLMYELASFSPPFLATNQIALAKKIVSETPKPLSKQYSMELQFLIFKMLEKDPSKRPDINHILNYSAVKLRIQKAKLRHKELKLKEQFLLLEKQIRTEYEMKIQALEKKLREFEEKEATHQQECQDLNEKSLALNKKEQELKDMEERLLKKQNQLNELIKNGHVIITPSLPIPPSVSPRSNNTSTLTSVNATTTTTTTATTSTFHTPSNLSTQPSTPNHSTSPFASPSKDIARDPSTTPQKKPLDSKYYKTETTKVVQEKFYNLYNMFHNDPHKAPPPNSQQQQVCGQHPLTPSPTGQPLLRPKSAPSTPIKKQTTSPEILLNPQTPSPKRLSQQQQQHTHQSRPKSTNAALDHNPHVRNKKKPVIVSPNIMMSPQAGLSSNTTASVQLDSNFVGKVMGKILMKKQSTKETPLGNKGRKQANHMIKEPSFDRVKKQLTFDDDTTILGQPSKKISPPKPPAVPSNFLTTPNMNNNNLDSSPHLDIAEPKVEIEESIFDYDDDSFDHDMEGVREDMMDLLVLRKKLKSEETA